MGGVDRWVQLIAPIKIFPPIESASYRKMVVGAVCMGVGCLHTELLGFVSEI